MRRRPFRRLHDDLLVEKADVAVDAYPGRIFEGSLFDRRKGVWIRQTVPAWVKFSKPYKLQSRVETLGGTIENSR